MVQKMPPLGRDRAEVAGAGGSQHAAGSTAAHLQRTLLDGPVAGARDRVAPV